MKCAQYPSMMTHAHFATLCIDAKFCRHAEGHTSRAVVIANQHRCTHLQLSSASPALHSTDNPAYRLLSFYLQHTKVLLLTRADVVYIVVGTLHPPVDACINLSHKAHLGVVAGAAQQRQAVMCCTYSPEILVVFMGLDSQAGELICLQKCHCLQTCQMFVVRRCQHPSENACPMHGSMWLLRTSKPPRRCFTFFATSAVGCPSRLW
jgi:hypothetical protein